MLFLLRYLWILFIYTISSLTYIYIVKIHYNLDYFSDWLWNDSESYNKIYDYVIVGAGSAGCVLAARLAENASVSILLIEAGGRPSPLYDIPLAAPMLQQTPYDWQYETEPQQNACLALKERRSIWPRGKILGGTSRLNYLNYLRGHPTDYESWVSDDCQHWNSHEIAEYFKRSENQLGLYANDTKHHSTLGPVAVSDLPYTSGLVKGLLGAAEELGLGVGDLNGEARGTGFMQTQATMKNGARFSTDRLLSGLTNVEVMLHTRATKILLRHGFETYGVKCERHGLGVTVRARREVIVSAGTVGSPHLLLLSGIGPAEQLSQHKIKVAVDLPVGENLQEHVSTGLDIVITNQSSPLSWHTAANPLNPLHYVLYGTGPLSHPGCEVVGLVRTKDYGTGQPDVQYMALPGGLTSDAGVVLKKAMGITEKLWRDYFAELVGTPVATLLPTVLHPRSRGFVRLRSSDYREPPVIDPRYLSHPEDVQVLIRGLEMLVKLTETKAMSAVGGRLYSKPLPPCRHYLLGSAAYWECYVRHITLTTYHPVGTCRMGSVSDPSSVVDHTLRVHGTSRLRVVDASVMPTMPSANINAAVMMIAEKAADLLKAQWHSRQATCRPIDVFVLRPTNCATS